MNPMFAQSREALLRKRFDSMVQYHRNGHAFDVESGSYAILMSL